jgi:hypothetical protein
VSADVAAGGGDVGCCGESVDADCEVAHSLNLIFIARWPFAGRSAAAREGGNAQLDGVLVVGASSDLGEFVLGAGEADLQSFDLSEPAFAFGLGDAGGEVSRISVSRSRWAGSGQSIEQQMQACSWMHGAPNAQPQVPVDTFRRSK